MTFETGLVIGKFYPLHKGHQYVIRAAVESCEHVYIVMTARASESIPGSVRRHWLKVLYPQATTILLPETTPYYPSECDTIEAFYKRWKQLLIDHIGFVPEAAFTSENYGEECEVYWGCKHVCVDKQRIAVPVSGSAIRSDPHKHWQFLHPVVRSYFVKTFCLFGPESCGKTTLSSDLAMHYGTIFQPEWAREYLGERHCDYDDMEIIARNHFAVRESFKQRANGVLFVDTDTITTKVFSEKYYDRYPECIDAIIDHPDNKNDLYLLVTPDVPWVQDTSRDLGAPDVRKEMFHRYKRELDNRNLPYVTIAGSDWNGRFRQAVTAVDRLLNFVGGTI